MNFSHFSLPKLAGAAGLSIALALGGSAALADDDDPTAYLYEGTCADISEASVVDEIDDLEDDDLDDIWGAIGNDQDQPDDLVGTEDDIDDLNDVQELVDGDYTVVVHESESRTSAILVCGDVEGEVQDGKLLIQLNEHDESGFEGRTLIQPDDEDDDDDDELEFIVGMFPSGEVEPLPASAPAD